MRNSILKGVVVGIMLMAALYFAGHVLLYLKG